MIDIRINGELISQAQLLSATLRLDLIPVPVTLEFNVIHDANLEKALTLESVITVANGTIELVIIKVQPIKTSTVKNGKRIAGIACVAIFNGLQRLIEPSSKAIVQSQSSFNAAIRACGAKSSLSNDIPLPEFICLKGHTPTLRLAEYLQKEACVMRFNGGSIECVKIDALFKQEPIAKYDPSGIAWVDNPSIKNNLISSFISVDFDGSNIVGEDTKASRPVQQIALTDARQLKNMSKVLFHVGTMQRAFDDKLLAGALVTVDNKNYVILTAVHHFSSGALAGIPVMASKVWLSELSQ